MWIGGLFSALATIIYPAISALVSKNANPEQQGVALGILTGVRGLCNGLGPALFGLLFWLFHVNLNDSDTPGVEPIVATSSVNMTTESELASVSLCLSVCVCVHCINCCSLLFLLGKTFRWYTVLIWGSPCPNCNDSGMHY